MNCPDCGREQTFTTPATNEKAALCQACKEEWIKQAVAALPFIGGTITAATVDTCDWWKYPPEEVGIFTLTVELGGKKYSLQAHDSGVITWHIIPDEPPAAAQQERQAPDKSLLRIRFKVNGDDYRPVKWPVKHPYWCTGYGQDFAIIVSYADDANYILENWPEANALDIEKAEGYVFSERFPKPEWFTEG